QANGIDEMSQAVAHLDEMTQQNAALSEQSAASANALSGRIEQLNELVATFKTDQGQTSASRAPVPARPAASEPDRLRQLAEAAFQQSRRPAPAETVKRAANARNGSTGWEEF
ncbi:methyl-accepting chemotaxis protein/methyl-accepting chemotaxis protein-1, serine sensor receptor, partial [Bosea robiniae]